VWAGLEARRRGELGATDVRELLDDAVDMALRDQEDAGIDLVTDGEMRRIGFFTADFYQRLTGLRALEPDRKLGVGGHDQLHRFEVLEPIAAPGGLGVVAEYTYARSRTNRPLKVTLPGPFTLAGRLVTGNVYRTRAQAAEPFIPILNVELNSLVQAGATFYPDRRAVASHPSAGSGGLRRALERRG
jgi:5-methyltetrahydropteroyltriglutamate--homocysteine methyltransferase